jgi:hypothetical protein
MVQSGVNINQTTVSFWSALFVVVGYILNANPKGSEFDSRDWNFFFFFFLFFFVGGMGIFFFFFLELLWRGRASVASARPGARARARAGQGHGQGHQGQARGQGQGQGQGQGRQGPPPSTLMANTTSCPTAARAIRGTRRRAREPPRPSKTTQLGSDRRCPILLPEPLGARRENFPLGFPDKLGRAIIFSILDR